MESDGEIEYLEEDAEIVQQCFQTPIVDTKPIPALIPDRNSPSLLVERQSNRTKSLLVERPSTRPGPSLLVERPPKRKRIKQDDDSDYDPNDAVLSPPSPKSKKKKAPPQKKRPKSETPTPRAAKYVKQIHEMKRMKTDEINKSNLVEMAEVDVSNRKKLNIRIPDYDDPLCLPVKAVRQENSDVKRLDVWNNACIEHFKHCDTMLKPETGATHSSFRTLVMRKVPNKQTGKIETTIWSKTSVQNQDGDKKSEIFQCVLPRYKEKKKMNSYDFAPKKFGHKKSNLSVDVSTSLSKSVREQRRKQISALRKRMRYATVKQNNPELYESIKEKDRKRYKNRKLKGQFESIRVKSPKEQKEQRKKWREAAKRYRERKNEIKPTIKEEPVIIYPEDGNELVSPIKNEPKAPIKPKRCDCTAKLKKYRYSEYEKRKFLMQVITDLEKENKQLRKALNKRKR